ncbi:hypothetical protein NEMBOFW57_001584 [Staphylotrichum longicolle]|uniref:RRM domain-containing protein n=1 Tax=Staphylotrichum longicolle TaxID=669026 RepID=A0AAD4F242_9PEZI|nr:hypothetical protein NEMBOFW57_001584 [Staphylotrichum longicolle]
MSAMLRANRARGSAGKARHVRLFSLSDAQFAEHMTATEDRRLTRSATAPNALVMGTPGDRNLFTPSSRHNVDGGDAQRVYPPSACVFVANLPESKDDLALSAAVTREFSKFGLVFVKIRREMKANSNGMPYAFVQYRNEEQAKVAVEKGRGVLIFGRPCRTEMVKANRTFVVYSRRGEETTVDMVREMLETYGELSKCESLSAQMQTAMDLPTAVLIEFAKFDPKRDLNSAVRQYDGYCIDAFDVKNRSLVPRPNADEEYLRKYDIDRRSVFVGGLPVDTTKEELIEHFASIVGEVIDANIVRRAGYQGFQAHVFGFVEFSGADIPDKAAEVMNKTLFRGAVIKVERKVFKHAGTPRRVRSQAFNVRSATTPKTPRAAAATAARSPMASGGRWSRRRATPAHAAQQGHDLSHGVQSLPPIQYPAPSPVAPANGHPPLVGASGMPVTPSSTHTFMPPNPYTWAGGYWPGMSIAHDPITGHAFWAYTPPVGPSAAPTVPSGTPTRAREREHEHHYFRGA